MGGKSPSARPSFVCCSIMEIASSSVNFQAAASRGALPGERGARAMDDKDARSAGVQAVEAGLTSGLTALAFSSLGVLAANKFWPAFRNGLNVR